jgi:hypothetical protein
VKSRVATTVAAAAALASCVTYRPSIAPASLPVARASDAALDCAQVETAIQRVDVARWVMRDDGAVLETSAHRAGRYAANVLLVPLAHGWWKDDGNAVLDAADRRLIELLRLKRASACAATPTARAGRTDLQVLEELEPLMQTSARSALDRRTQLLDELRAVAPR